MSSRLAIQTSIEKLVVEEALVNVSKIRFGLLVIFDVFEGS